MTPPWPIWHPVETLFLGPGHSRVDQHHELITRFRFRATNARSRSAFKRIMRPQGVALPILAMAVWVEFEADDETVAGARIALGPAGPTPRRATAAESYLVGKRLQPDTIQALAQRVLTAASLRTSKHRATQAYRTELIPVLVQRNFETIRQRIQQTEVAPEGIGLG